MGGSDAAELRTLRVARDEDRVVTVWMDLPDKPVNICTPLLFQELGRVLDELEQERPAGLIVASAKARSFNAGADLFDLNSMEPEELAGYIADGQAVFARLAELGTPTVAAIDGDCLGGGLELALACGARVAADDPAVTIGPPEVKLGLIPAWGGCLRLPRLVGLEKALPMLLSGRTVSPRVALEMGLVDEVAPAAELMAAARRQLKAGVRRDRDAMPAESVRAILDKAADELRARTRGHYPAPMNLIDVVRRGYEGGDAAAAEAEREGFLELMTLAPTRNLMRVFFLRQGARKRAAKEAGATPRTVNAAAVIGGGVMGSGIAHALLRAGITVRVIETDERALAAARARLERVMEEDVSGGRVTSAAAGPMVERLTLTTAWDDLGGVDLVVEAVVEDLAVKRAVFERLGRLTRTDAVLASNTSSLSVSEMAEATAHPERVVGLHFFNPVPKIPAAEIVRAARSDAESLATAVAVAVRLGKAPLVVRDSPGFVVNRILFPYIAEAARMVGEGVAVEEIDRAMGDWGMPKGPLELLDEIGLDVGASILASLERGGVMKEIPPSIAAAVARGWLGRKAARGFYMHGAGSARRANEEMAELVRGGVSAAGPIDVEATQWRLVLPMVNEATRILGEPGGASAETIDLAVVLGLGLAPFRGGILRFMESVGAGETVRRMEELARRHGERFAPSPWLRAAAGR